MLVVQTHCLRDVDDADKHDVIDLVNHKNGCMIGDVAVVVQPFLAQKVDYFDRLNTSNKEAVLVEPIETVEIETALERIVIAARAK